MDQSSLSTTGTQPIRKFALFFRGYNVGLSLIVAAVPVLIGVWDFIPLYANTKIFLTGITSLGSYLLVGFIFSQRISIGRLYFIGASRAAYALDIRRSRFFRLLPLVFMILSIFCFYAYLSLLNLSIKWVAYDNIIPKGGIPAKEYPRNVMICDAQSLSLGQRAIIPAEFVAFGKRSDVTVYCERSNDEKNDYVSYRIGFPDQNVVQTILAQTPSPSIPLSFLTNVFLCAFLFATSAFIFMGLREYIQEELRLKDEDMIRSPLRATRRRRFYLDGAPGLYGIVEFSPDDASLAPQFEGPFCIWHNLPPTPKEFDDQGKPRGWIHVIVKDDKKVEQPCTLDLKLEQSELNRLLREQGDRLIKAETAAPNPKTL